MPAEAKDTSKQNNFISIVTDIKENINTGNYADQCLETDLLTAAAPEEDDLEEVLTEINIESHVRNEIKNRFFNELYENELDLNNKFSDPEIKDIHEAVHRQLKLLATTIGEKDERLKIQEVIPVGSAREGTQIIRPCEYDFLLTLETLSKPGVVSIKPANPNVSSREYVCVKLEDNDVRSMFPEISVNNIIRCSDQLSLRLLYFPCRKHGLSSLLCYRQGLRGLSCTRQGLRDLFSNAVYEAILSSRSAVQMKTGKLRTRYSKPEEHGPAFTITLLWERETIENHPTMEISIDLVPALKLHWEIYNNLLTDAEGFVINHFDHVRSVGSILLLPRNGMRFHVNFTEAELLRTRNLSEHHKKCYKLLKFILNGEPFPLERNKNWLMKYFQHTQTKFHSYSLKLVVWEHHYLQQCTEETDLSLCIPKMLTRIRCSLTEGLIHPFHRNRIVVPSKSSTNVQKKQNFLCKARMDTLSCVLTKMDNMPIEDYSYEIFRRAIAHHQLWRYKAKLVCWKVLILTLVISLLVVLVVWTVLTDDGNDPKYVIILVILLLGIFYTCCCCDPIN